MFALQTQQFPIRGKALSPPPPFLLPQNFSCILLLFYYLFITNRRFILPAVSKLSKCLATVVDSWKLCISSTLQPSTHYSPAENFSLICFISSYNFMQSCTMNHIIFRAFYLKNVVCTFY